MTRTFDRVYAAVAALTVAGLACLRWLVPLSYRVLGLDPQLARAGTYAAFQASMATFAIRMRFVSTLLYLALGLLALSLVALVLRRRRRTRLPWPLVAAGALVALGGALIAVAALQMAGGGMCC